MKVKLTTRRPGDATLATLCQEGAMMHDDGINAWEAAHDAAPDDATRALEQHLRTVRMVVNGEASLNDLGGSYDGLQATPETAALIRQAEERSGST